jgi:FkbM family methyltransferase
MCCCVRFVIGKTTSRILAAYYRGPDHPLKLRLWRYMRQLCGYRPLTLAYGDGCWITIDERDWLQSSIFTSGAYEPEVWGALAHYASRDEIVWDVGAHIGSFVLRAAQDRRVRSVCAFEPDPLTLKTLTANLALNGNPAIVYPLALSDTTERRTLIHGPNSNAGMSTLNPTANTGMIDHLSDHRDELPTFDVHCRPADELIAEGQIQAPTLMKIDVEGWEYQVFNGAQQLLRSNRLKAITFEASCDATGGLTDDRLKALLSSHGYSVSRIHRPEGGIRGVENYLAVPQ